MPSATDRFESVVWHDRPTVLNADSLHELHGQYARNGASAPSLAEWKYPCALKAGCPFTSSAIGGLLPIGVLPDECHGIVRDGFVHHVVARRGRIHCVPEPHVREFVGEDGSDGRLVKASVCATK